MAMLWGPDERACPAWMRCFCGIHIEAVRKVLAKPNAMQNCPHMVQASGDSRPIVTVTGISGFIGSHVGLTLLRDGSFKVRGTVRSKTNADKIDPLR